MKRKFTPGQWTYGRMLLTPADKDRRCGFVVNGPDAPSNKDFPVRICDLRVPSGINGFSEGEANARLIAAAPELHELARAFVAYLEDDSKSPRRSVECMIQACAVLAKVDGKPE